MGRNGLEEPLLLMFELCFFLYKMSIVLSDTCRPSSVKGQFSSLRYQRFEVDILRQVLFKPDVWLTVHRNSVWIRKTD